MEHRNQSTVGNRGIQESFLSEYRNQTTVGQQRYHGVISDGAQKLEHSGQQKYSGVISVRAQKLEHSGVIEVLRSHFGQSTETRAQWGNRGTQESFLSENRNQSTVGQQRYQGVIFVRVQNPEHCEAIEVLRSHFCRSTETRRQWGN